MTHFKSHTDVHLHLLARTRNPPRACMLIRSLVRIVGYTESMRKMELEVAEVPQVIFTHKSWVGLVDSASDRQRTCDWGCDYDADTNPKGEASLWCALLGEITAP